METWEAQRRAERWLRRGAHSAYLSAWNLTDDDEIAQHLIPPGSPRMHFAFLGCWCRPDESNPLLVEHVHVGS